ncbi:MAG: glycosyltransferase [Chitinophagaceae bacterium]|nr:glycosyltransferase [Chitinophagaceae bacterium]
MALQVFTIFWIVLQVAIALILLFPVICYTWWLLLPKTQKIKSQPILAPDYGIIVTAYKYAGNLPNVITSLLNQDYPHYMIYVVADNCGDDVIFPEHDKLVILKPKPALSNQLKSHFLAINNFNRPHNIVTIIDSDNLTHPAYLSGLNKWFNRGFKAVQGVRAAKNTNTEYASLDAVNEMYYLFYDRKILFGIGSSCMLSGSGMAFTTALYKECLQSSNSSGAGFDKILQKEILLRNHRIAFAENAIVYDEKTASADQLVKQRARWINTWFRYSKFGFQLMLKGIINFNLNQWLFGFVLVRPPLFMLLFLCLAITVINFFINPYFALAWVFALLFFTLGFFLALYNSGAGKNLYKALWHIPKFVFLQIVSLFKAKKANEISVSTQHQIHEEIDTLIK